VKAEPAVRPGETSAEALRRALGEPVYNRILKQSVGNGDLEYEVYLRTKTLLHLQYPPDERVSFDELLFQIVHQVQELWMKLLCEEAVELVADLDAERVWDGSARLERMVRIQRALGAEMAIIETLTPDQFAVIRRSLGTGSGQESPGFNHITAHVGPAVEAALLRACERRSVTLADVYREGPSPAPDLKRLCEQAVDLDEAFQQWLMFHFLLVRRTIGVAREVHALDGLPTNALIARMVQPLMPTLWHVRVELTKSWAPGGGYPVGADRKRPPKAGP
jgi:tryptophan 2,3-dioxygenase